MEISINMQGKRTHKLSYSCNTAEGGIWLPFVKLTRCVWGKKIYPELHGGQQSEQFPHLTTSLCLLAVGRAGAEEAATDTLDFSRAMSPSGNRGNTAHWHHGRNTHIGSSDP